MPSGIRGSMSGGRYLWQRLLAQALHMAARRPTILILAEAQSKAGPGDPPS